VQKEFREKRADIVNGLTRLRARILDNKSLTDKIRHKYRLKNTTGYSINSLVDFEDPVDILAHLMVGSEGTLGFVSNITYNTVEDPKHKVRYITQLAPARYHAHVVGSFVLVGAVIGCGHKVNNRHLQCVHTWLVPLFW
jgi:D-lactate dehydrogenase